MINKVMKTWDVSGGRKNFTVSLYDNGSYSCTCSRWKKGGKYCEHTKKIRYKVNKNIDEINLLRAVYYERNGYEQIIQSQKLTIKQLASLATKGKYSIEKATIGFKGYGFVFRKHDCKDEIVASTWNMGGGKAFSIESSSGKVDLNMRNATSYAGALKTLLLDIELGASESLFDIWMWVETPMGEAFPATFYYGMTGTSIGDFSDKSKRIGPLQLSEEERREFIVALKGALNKVFPISDFSATFDTEYGPIHMGVRGGQPFIGYDEKRRLSTKEEQDDHFRKISNRFNR